MRFRPRRLAVWVLLAVVSPWGCPEASAGLATYEWYPLSGGGYEITYPGNQEIPFTADGGSLLIGYDPDSPSNSFIDVWIGGPGFQVTAFEDFQASSAFGGLTLSALGSYGQSVTVIFPGGTGPLGAPWPPESLDAFVDTSPTVEVRGAYDMPDQFVFNGQAEAVPEPSALVSLIVGVGGVWLAGLARRRIGAMRAGADSRAR